MIGAFSRGARLALSHPTGRCDNVNVKARLPIVTDRDIPDGAMLVPALFAGSRIPL